MRELYLLVPAGFFVAAAYAICTLPTTIDAGEPMDVACRLMDGYATWQAIGGRQGMRYLYASAINMLRLVANRPDLPKTRNELLLMAACLYLVSRWCLFVEDPLKKLFTRMPRTAAHISAEIYCQMAATYTATYTVAME